MTGLPAGHPPGKTSASAYSHPELAASVTAVSAYATVGAHHALREAETVRSTRCPGRLVDARDTRSLFLSVQGERPSESDMDRDQAAADSHADERVWNAAPETSVDESMHMQTERTTPVPDRKYSRVKQELYTTAASPYAPSLCPLPWRGARVRVPGYAHVPRLAAWRQ
jgi:hypothetical protein